MQNATAQNLETADTKESGLATLLQGYRFRVCEDAETFLRALEVRRQVYVEDFGYDVPVPDEYDHRSWLLIAEHVETGEIIGTMRMTPRAFGAIEAEEYFELPNDLDRARTIEISRFAIRSAYRKTKTFFPVISVGLFKLCYEFAHALGIEREVVCSKAERMWTYQSMGFQSTGITAQYEKLKGAEHELLWHDFREAGTWLAGNPFHELFCDLQFDEIVVPTSVPPLGLIEEPAMPEPFRLAVGA